MLDAAVVAVTTKGTISARFLPHARRACDQTYTVHNAMVTGTPISAPTVNGAFVRKPSDNLRVRESSMAPIAAVTTASQRDTCRNNRNLLSAGTTRPDSNHRPANC